MGRACTRGRSARAEFSPRVHDNKFLPVCKFDAELIILRMQILFLKSDENH